MYRTQPFIISHLFNSSHQSSYNKSRLHVYTQHNTAQRHATKTIEVHRQSDVITASIPGISRKFQHFKYFSERDNTSSDHLQNVCTVKIEPKRFRE